MVREVLGAALSSEARTAPPGEVRHCLVADLVSGSEHCAVPGWDGGGGEGVALYLWPEAPASQHKIWIISPPLHHHQLPFSVHMATRAVGRRQAFQGFREGLRSRCS